ncbi:MAG: hypothetical protein KC931_14850 [Candidatus Omnitrophica bacterium]|nr:hypothetical protein [Candidatus Omnitrophota bacterium]MCA9434936.1 hypothetical protein [Candidatus Omnitrophota bacterium]MCA9448397.1 hypothetical protein [Candidatus Omnitrophota bacterium]
MTEATVPKHHRIAERIARMSRTRGKYAQSILIHGPMGAEHREVAVRFGQSVFCDTGEGDFGACGVCRSCRRVHDGTHPDWVWMEPDRSGKGLPNITIEMVRNLQDRMVLNPYEGSRVVGCIFEAEKMRPETANSLLKLVEEPPPHALFILVTDNLERILPTIRSRCLPVPLGPPDPSVLAARIARDLSVSDREALQTALWAIQEGLTPQEAASEPVRELRDEAVELLDLAIRMGEHAFLPALKSRKYSRESNLVLIRHFRDFLSESLLLSEGRAEPLVYRSHHEPFSNWTRTLPPDKLSDLIDLSFEFEEGILGYANPTHSIATFLSEVSRASEK